MAGILIGDVNRLNWDATNGRLGIGTNAPVNTLHIVGNNLRFDRYANPGVLAGYRFNGTSASPTKTLANENLFNIVGRGYQQTTNAITTANSSMISFWASEDFTSTAQGGYITFTTVPTGSTTASERMRIDSTGNVGIGKSPAVKFDVAGGRSQFAANSEIYAVGFKYNDAAGPFYIGASNSATPDLIFSQAGGAERMRLDNGGNLGIGLIPANTLHVKGGITIQSPAAGGTFAHFGADRSTDYTFLEADSYPTAGDGYTIFGLRSWSSLTGVKTSVATIQTFKEGAGTDNKTAFNISLHNGTSSGERFRITSDGKVGVGVTPLAKLHVGTGTGWGSGIRVSGSNDNAEFYCSADNEFAIDARADGGAGGCTLRLNPSSGNVQSDGIYNSTTASAANVYIAGTGVLQRSTSSIRYKTDVQDYSKGLNVVNQLRPVNYKGINDGEKVFAGFIAEEIDALNLTEFVVYNEQNQPESLHYSNMVALLTKAIQELSAQNDALKARLDAAGL